MISPATFAPRTSPTKLVSDKIWIGKVAYSFEVVQSFVQEAEKLRKAHPQAFVTILMAAKDETTPGIFGKDVPIEHPWFKDSAAQAVALALALTFYKFKAASPVHLGYVGVQREDAVDGLDCDMETHREILRMTLEGIL